MTFSRCSLMLLISLLYTQVCSSTLQRAGSTSSVASRNSNEIAFPLQRTPDGGAYLLNVSFTSSDGYTVPLKIDLSSPETWVNTPTTYCWNPGNLPGLTGGSCGVTAPEPSCQGTPQRMFEYYNSDNTSFWGKVCSADLALGPVEIDCQHVLYVDQTWIQPDEASAGVLGLAYPESIDTQPVGLSPSPAPTNSSASATTASTPTPTTDISFLANLFHQHDVTSSLYILPIVNLAISRDTSGVNNAGEILFGGSFSTINDSLVNISSPVTIPMSFSNFSGPDGTVYDDASMRYTVPIDSIFAMNAGIQPFHFNATSGYQMVISTSDTAISLPPSLASAVNGMFIPPGFLAADNSTYYVHCDSVAPSVNFGIKNQTFFINPIDMKRHASQSLCISSVTASSGSHYVLGDLFLRNVLLELDFRSNTLSLFPRPDYGS